MELITNSKKLTYLYENNGIVDVSLIDEETLTNEYTIIETNSSVADTFVIALKRNHESKFVLSTRAFIELVNGDPTKKKLYVQWYLNLINRNFNNGNINQNIKIISEDLPSISESLDTFDKLKKTKRFKDVTSKLYALKNIPNTLDILQYNTPSELYDAIYPFLDNSAKGLELILSTLVDEGEGDMMVNDKNFIVFRPKTLKAAEVFGQYSTWCTARKGNGMFDHYTNMKQPNGSSSSLYILIDKRDEDKPKMMQIHFESNQFCDNTNKNNPNLLITNYINESNGIRLFLSDTLLKLLQESANSKTNRSSYVTYLNTIQQFGFFGHVVNSFNSETTTSIDFKSLSFAEPFEIKPFKNLTLFSVVDSNLTKFPTIQYSKQLRVVSLYKNSITELPPAVFEAKFLVSLNLGYNKIQTIPNDIKNLDPANGGSLANLSLIGNPLSDEEKVKIESLLPNVLITF